MGSYYNVPKAIFYLLKGDYTSKKPSSLRESSLWKLDLEQSQTRSLQTQTLPGPQKVCKIMARMAVIMGLGLLCYILLGSR